jgi:hypothetical protein
MMLDYRFHKDDLLDNIYGGIQMKKVFSPLALALVLFAIMPIALAAVPYDSPTVKNYMHHNLADLGKVQASIDAKDFAALGDAFSDFLVTATALKAMDPPKGDPGMWMSFWTDFAAAATKGIAAAKDNDAVKASEALAAIKSIMGQGHKNFRY